MRREVPRRVYRPEWEAELLDLSRVYAYLAQERWFRLARNAGTVSLGSQVYVLGRTPWARQQVEITFNSSDQHVVFHSEDGEEVKCLSIKGLTLETLMGKWDRWSIFLRFNWSFLSPGTSGERYDFVGMVHPAVKSAEIYADALSRCKHALTP